MGAKVDWKSAAVQVKRRCRIGCLFVKYLAEILCRVTPNLNYSPYDPMFTVYDFPPSHVSPILSYTEEYWPSVIQFHFIFSTLPPAPLKNDLYSRTKVAPPKKVNERLFDRFKL